MHTRGRGCRNYAWPRATCLTHQVLFWLVGRSAYQCLLHLCPASHVHKGSLQPVEHDRPAWDCCVQQAEASLCAHEPQFSGQKLILALLTHMSVSLGWSQPLLGTIGSNRIALHCINCRKWHSLHISREVTTTVVADPLLPDTMHTCMPIMPAGCPCWWKTGSAVQQHCSAEGVLGVFAPAPATAATPVSGLSRV